MKDTRVITLTDVSKQYPNGTMAVDTVSFGLERGEICGILGPNGSGKTTTILMLLGLTEPTSGTIDILGMNPLYNPLEIKRSVAYMPDTVGFYDYMSAYANIDYTARLLGLDTRQRRARINEALQKMGLTDRMNDPVKTFSHGMKRRLGLAEILVKQPAIAILDEPTQGLDPQSVEEFLDLIVALRREEGMTVLLSSHNLNEVQSICDRVALFYKGKMELFGTLQELANKMFGGNHEITICVSGKSIDSQLEKIPAITSSQKISDTTYRIVSTEDVRAHLVKQLVSSGIDVYSVSDSIPSLEEIYRAYYKEVGHAA